MSATASSRRKKKNARDEKHATHDTFPHDARPSPCPRRGISASHFTQNLRINHSVLASAEAEIFRHDFPQTDRDSWTRRPEAALRRRFEIRGWFWFHPDKTIRSRDAHMSLNSESSSADGARDGGPRRDRGWSRERRSFDGPFGASRETRAKRAERRRKTKRNFAFCDLFQIRSSRRARRRGKRERFSLSWFAGDQTLGFQREVRCRRMATRNAAKGARCSIRRRRRADAPRTFRRFRSATLSLARPFALSVSVPGIQSLSSFRDCVRVSGTSL